MIKFLLGVITGMAVIILATYLVIRKESRK